MTNNTLANVYVGIDIAKNHLDIAVMSESIRTIHKQFPNTPSGISNLIRCILAYDNLERVVLEPSGGYEKLLKYALHNAGILDFFRNLLLRCFRYLRALSSKEWRCYALRYPQESIL